jgi:hypothetical protein
MLITFFTRLQNVRFDLFYCFFLPTIDGLMIFYNAPVRCKPEYASVACKSITIIDSSKRGRIQRKLAALCYSRLLTSTFDNRYDDISIRLNLSTLWSRRLFLGGSFFISVLRNKLSLLIHSWYCLFPCTYRANQRFFNFCCSPSCQVCSCGKFCLQV